jgi:hypothetical protein
MSKSTASPSDMYSNIINLPAKSLEKENVPVLSFIVKTPLT